MQHRSDCICFSKTNLNGCYVFPNQANSKFGINNLVDLSQIKTRPLIARILGHNIVWQIKLVLSILPLILALTRSLIHLLTPPSFLLSFVSPPPSYLSTYSTLSFFHLFFLTHLFTKSSIHSLTHSFTRPLLEPS